MKNSDKVIGFRETARMLRQNKVDSVILANDVDEKMKEEILSLCEKRKVDVTRVSSKRKLGRTFGIERPAAVVATLKDD